MVAQQALPSHSTRSLIQSWSQVTVFCMLCLHLHPPTLKSMPVGGFLALKWTSVHVWVHGGGCPIQGIFLPRAPRIGSRSTETLTRIKVPINEQLKDNSVTITNWGFEHCLLVVQAFITLSSSSSSSIAASTPSSLSCVIYSMATPQQFNNSRSHLWVFGTHVPLDRQTDRCTGQARPPAVLFFSSTKVQMVWNFAEWISSKSSSMRNGWERGGGRRDSPSLSSSHT